MATRKYVNGFPLLIMLSIRSRESVATVFEIENDLEAASGLRPSAGAVYSALGNLARHDQVRQTKAEIDGLQTYEFSLTDCGSGRVDWMLAAIDALREIKAPEQRGPRRSKQGRRRRDCRPDAGKEE